MLKLVIEIDGARLDTLTDFQEEVSEHAIPGAFWGELPMDREFDSLALIYIRGIYCV